MKKLFFTFTVFVTSVTCFSQTEVPVSNRYVLDGETGELIQVVQPSELNVRYVNRTVEQPQQVIVVDNRDTKFERAVNTAAQVVTAAVITGSLIHAVRHHHHHYRHSYYCPPPRPVYHHHHHRPVHRPHHRR